MLARLLAEKSGSTVQPNALAFRCGKLDQPGNLSPYCQVREVQIIIHMIKYIYTHTTHTPTTHTHTPYIYTHTQACTCTHIHLRVLIN